VIVRSAIAPNLLLIHGLGSDHRYWDDFTPRLSDEFDVLALDLPGHGDQAQRLSAPEGHPRALAASVAAQLGNRGIERPHVVGLSLGGWVALELAAMGRCSSVVALAPAGLWGEGTHVRRERQSVTLGPLVRVLGPALPSLLRHTWVKKLALAKNVANPDGVSNQSFLAAARAIGTSRGYSACEKAMVGNRFLGGRRIDVPTTVAFGHDDRVFPGAKFQNHTELPPHTKIEIIADCGHAMTWDQPDACLELIRTTSRLAE
jgi:pimeloyl-ACP methyl ester carboxylesterase